MTNIISVSIMKFFGLVLVAIFIASVSSENSIFVGKRIDGKSINNDIKWTNVQLYIAGDQVIAVQHRASEFFSQPTNFTYTFDYKGNGQIFNITGFHVDLHVIILIIKLKLNLKIIHFLNRWTRILDSH